MAALATATLAGLRATEARAAIPKWGCWYADASLDGEHELTGQVELVMADLTLKGTILSGGPSNGRSDFRIVAGKGGWGKEIAEKGYTNDAGVKISTVIGDAALAAGETLDPASVPSTRVGPAFARPKDIAARVLELLAPSAWYVGEDGVTRLGARASSPLSGKATHGPVDRARGTVTLASDAIATIVPGVIVDGLEAVDVLHEIGAKGGLRSTIWGAQGRGTSRRLAALRAIFNQLDPDRKFRGVTEYRVVTQSGERLDLQPVRVSLGMPELRRVIVRPGVSGASSQVMLASKVLVAFVNADPSRPIVVGFEDAEGEGFVPLETHLQATLLRLNQGARPVAAAGDLAGGIWPVVPTQTTVLV